MPEELEVRCPSCNGARLELSSMLYSIPFFNQLVIFTLKCPECNFLHNDVFSAESRKPGRWEYRVKRPDMLNTRVVRSGSGTIRLPEFGIDVEPGPAAESFISNVEGVVMRVRSVVETAADFAEESGQKSRGQEVLRMMDEALAGTLPFTLVLEDPAGTSGILPDDMTEVEYKELSAKEASQLRGAPLWLDAVREEYREQHDVR